MKLKYFQNKSVEFASDSRKLWRLLNQIIGKTKNKGSIIPYITINGLKTHAPNKMANEFGKFYSTVGERMASKIVQGQYNISHYLSKIPRNIGSLVMRSINILEIENII